MEDFLPLTVIYPKPAQTVAGIAYNLLHAFFQISDPSLYKNNHHDLFCLFWFFLLDTMKICYWKRRKHFTSCWKTAELLIICQEEEGQMNVIHSTLNYFTHMYQQTGTKAQVMRFFVLKDGYIEHLKSSDWGHTFPLAFIFPLKCYREKCRILLHCQEYNSNSYLDYL